MTIGIDASRAFAPQPSGTENYSANLISAFAKIDRKNQYKLYVRPSNSLTTRLPANFEIVKIGWRRLWTQAGLALECLLHPVDILFIPAHTLPVIRRPNLKTIVTIHDLGSQFLPGYHTFPQKLYLDFSTKYAVSHADCLIAVSQNTKKDLIDKFAAKPEKIFVVYEGVDENRFKVKGERLKIKKILEKYKIKKPYILFVGTIQPRKNLVRLIEAFAMVDDRPDTLNLVLAGRRGWLAEDIYAAPAKFKVAKKVKFLDYVPAEDLPLLYSEAEVFVLPSLMEGFGLPILESFACRVPVVCSKTSSLPEVAGEAAVYVDPENPGDIANGILKVLTNQGLRRQLIAKGYRQLNKFSWEVTAKQTLEIFEKVYAE